MTTTSTVEKQLSPRLSALSSECATLGCIKLQLCDLNALSGIALRHSINVLETLFRKEDPCVFKLGYTHDPIWRWTNDVYGYCRDRQGWTNMIIMYYAKEPYGPAMLEAALIEKFQSNQVATLKVFKVDLPLYRMFSLYTWG